MGPVLRIRPFFGKDVCAGIFVEKVFLAGVRFSCLTSLGSVRLVGLTHDVMN